MIWYIGNVAAHKRAISLVELAVRIFEQQWQPWSCQPSARADLVKTVLPVPRSLATGGATQVPWISISDPCRLALNSAQKSLQCQTVLYHFSIDFLALIAYPDTQKSVFGIAEGVKRGPADRGESNADFENTSPALGR